LYPQ
jgi:hypothetical protein